MKKIVLFLLLLFTPLFVFAKDTCDPSNIKIESITLEDTKGNIEEVKKASSNSQKINLGLRMNVVGDTASYKIVLKNNSNEDYYFDEKSLNLDTDYVDYTVSYEDDNNLTKSGEEKILFLKVVYKEKMDSSTLENGLYQDTQVVKLNLTNNNLVEEIIENPITGRGLGVLIFLILWIGFFLFYKDKKKSAYLFLLLGFTLPFSVHGLCRHSLEIENELVIDTREAIFLPGREINAKMKQLAGDDTSTVTYAYSFKDEMITSIQYSEVEPNSTNKEEKNIVSIPESGYPIYMWYDNRTIYWWSEDMTPSLNKDASLMFFEVTNLNDISGLQTFDSSNVDTFLYFFGNCKLSSLRNLSLWNVGNAHSFIAFFRNNSNLESLDGIENWDVSNVTNMTGLFASCSSLKNISSISNWDTSNVVNMSSMFVSCQLLTDLNSISNWNLSNVISLSGMFRFCNSISNLIPLRNWNVSNVTDFNSLFRDCISLESLSGLENWSVSKVLNYNYMFSGSYNLRDVSSINDWDISKDANYTRMFGGVSAFPVFTNMSGTWNNGTFIPTE